MHARAKGRSAERTGWAPGSWARTSVPYSLCLWKLEANSWDYTASFPQKGTKINPELYLVLILTSRESSANEVTLRDMSIYHQSSWYSRRPETDGQRNIYKDTQEETRCLASASPAYSLYWSGCWITGYYTPNSTYAHQLVRLGVRGIDSSVGKMPTAKPDDLSLNPESTWWNGENWLPSKCPLIFTRVLWHMCTRTHMQINKCNKWNKNQIVNPKFLLPQRHQSAVEENL